MPDSGLRLNLRQVRPVAIRGWPRTCSASPYECKVCSKLRPLRFVFEYSCHNAGSGLDVSAPMTEALRFSNGLTLQIEFMLSMPGIG